MRVTAMALQKSREAQLRQHGEGSEESEDENMFEKKRKRNGRNRRRVSHGNWRECVWKKPRLNVCGHFVGLVAGKEL